MIENEIGRVGVVFGSYKPDRWSQVIDGVAALEHSNVHVMVPRDKNLITTSLSDNPEFYYLQSDLDDAGITEDELLTLPTCKATEKLNFRKLELNNYKVIKKLGENCYSYIMMHNDTLGKSTAYELSLSILFRNQIALNNKPEYISVEVGDLTKRFLAASIPHIPVVDVHAFSVDKFQIVESEVSKEERLDLIKEALQTLLRRKFSPYERPANEFTCL